MLCFVLQQQHPAVGVFVDTSQCSFAFRPEQGNEGEAEGENDPHFEPVIKLEQQVETKTHEEDEDVLFKM